MKIYYEENGYWDDNVYNPVTQTLYLNSNIGYKHSTNLFELYTENHVVSEVFTSCVWLLNCSDTNDVYIWSNKHSNYIHVNKLTDKEIKPTHNIEMMYRNGAFDYELECAE